MDVSIPQQAVGDQPLNVGGIVEEPQYECDARACDDFAVHKAIYMIQRDLAGTILGIVALE